MHGGRAEAAASVDRWRGAGPGPGAAVALDRGVGAVARLAHQVAEALDRGVAVADRVVGGLAVGAVGFPCPVLERQLALQAGRHLPDGVVVDRRAGLHPAVVVGGGDQPGCPLRGGGAEQLVVQQGRQLGRNRVLRAGRTGRLVARRGRIVGGLVVRQRHAPAADERRGEQVRGGVGVDEGAAHIGGQVVGDVVVGCAIHRPAAERRGDEVVVDLVGLEAGRDRAVRLDEVLVGDVRAVDRTGVVHRARPGVRVAEGARRQGPVVVDPEKPEGGCRYAWR